MCISNNNFLTDNFWDEKHKNHNFQKTQKVNNTFLSTKKIVFLTNNVINNTKRENEFRWSSFLNFRVLDCSFHSSWNRRFYSMNGSFICRDFSRKVQVKKMIIFDRFLIRFWWSYLWNSLLSWYHNFTG